jgi:glycine/D-amino acid oxidase-like deaminating enzyme
LRFPQWRGLDSGGGWRSLWVEQALAREGELRPRVLNGPARADVAIVGGGFTGLWTALRLRELDPQLSIAIVEADLCGTGASGRNGGAVSHWWAKLPTLEKLLGPADAVTLVRASSAAIDGVMAFVDENDLDCLLRRTAGIWTATSDVQVGAWNRVLDTAKRLDLTPPYRPLSTDELKALLPGGPHRAAMIDETARRVQPAALARGLRRVAIERGIAVYERSPVQSIDLGDAVGVRITTAAGELTAAKAVLAANAWMAHLPEFKSQVMVVSSDVIATEPVGDELIAELGLDRVGGFNSRMMVNYFAASGGRVFMGRGGGTLATFGHIGRSFSASPKQTAQVRADLSRMFPRLAGRAITHAWAGPVDRSPMGLPWFEALRDDDRVHYAIGYAGHGVGASAMGGKILASQLLDRDDEYFELGRLFSRARGGAFPREPARTLGGFFVRRAVGRKEAADDAGRTPKRVDVALSRLAPATMADTKRGSKR